MQFSVTEIQTWQRCRRQWALQSMNRLNLQPVINNSVALNLGTLIHQTLASWIMEPDQNPLVFFVGHSHEMFEKCKQDYIKLVGANPSDEELEPVYAAMDLGKEMIVNYHTRWKKPLPAHMEIAAPEQLVSVPIPDTDHTCEPCNGTGLVNDASINDTQKCPECAGIGIVQHYLKCTFDGLLQNVNGNIFILEHKTYAQRPNLKYLERNNQFLAYIWAAQQLQIGNVVGIAYDGMLKKAKPGIYKGKRETLEDLFIRKMLPRPQFEVDEWARHAAVLVNEMASAPPEIINPILYPNRRWEGCYDCKVEPVCAAMSLDEDWEAVIRRGYTQRVLDDALGVAEQ